MTCAHVVEALLKEAEIGILCAPVRAKQIQTLRLEMMATDYIALGTGPCWTEHGPDLAFLRLPPSIIGNIERLATIINGDQHRLRMVSGDTETTLKLPVLAGFVNEVTEPVSITPDANGVTSVTSLTLYTNIGQIIVDDESADRFRFQPVTSEGWLRRRAMGA